MVEISRVSVTILFMALPACAKAPEAVRASSPGLPPPVTPRCVPESLGGRIAGQVVTMEGGPIQNAIVKLPALQCETFTTMTGQFAFDDVPTGEYHVTASWIGYERSDTTVVVNPNRFEPVTIQLSYGNGLKWICPLWPECESLPPDSTLELATVRTLNVLADSISGLKNFQDIAKCIEYKQASMDTRAPSRKTATGGQCTIRRGWVETVAREPAILLLVDIESADSVSSKATLGYYVGPLFSGSWRCRFERKNAGWRVRHCDYPIRS